MKKDKTTAASQNSTILVVDDVATNIDLLVALLGDEFQVSVAMDGQTALEDIARNPPDMVLLDIMMPDMDGYEVCRRLKASEKTRNIPVIFVTGKRDAEDEAQGFAVGGADYITKPFNPPLVMARILTHLELKRQRDQLRDCITRMQFEAEILRQKAELGIHAGCLAHDLNNILTSASYIKRLPKHIAEDVPGRQQLLEDIEWIMNSLHLGSQICNGYTSYLKNIGEDTVVQPILPLLQPLEMYTKKFRGRLMRDYAAVLPMLKCRGYQLKRVFVNLFVNAMQSLEGRQDQQITLRLWAAGDRIYFAITDNGPGIPAEILPHIFEERFTSKPGGTGLGLFLARQIVLAHNGTIAVQSEPENGTTFTLSFPTEPVAGTGNQASRAGDD